jgi:hypothetical protein
MAHLWACIEINDGTPLLVGIYGNTLDAEHALIEHQADVSDLTFADAMAELKDATRTEHADGSISWDDHNCWSAWIVECVSVSGATAGIIERATEGC